MNKIFIDTKNYSLNIEKDENCFLEIFDNDVELVINIFSNIKSTINLLIKNSNVKILINLSSNSDLTINELGINSSISCCSNIKYNSKIRYAGSILTNIDSINNFEINHLESNSNSYFMLSGINANTSKFYYNIDGNIEKTAINSLLEQNSKIINLSNGDSKIVPNLIVNNNDVVANHSAFIGNFEEEKVLYLNSRGIGKEDSFKLLIKSLLLGEMFLESEKDKFIKFLIDNIYILEKNTN